MRRKLSTPFSIRSPRPLRRDEAVSFTGFGKFSPQQRKERQGVNPRTGERVSIPAARVPKFSAGSALKQALKSSGQ